MKIIRKFRIEEHPEHGSLGLRLVGNNQFEPFAGMGTTHDIMEHFPKDDASDIAAEMKAFGASYLVRAVGGYWDRKASIHSPAANMASDMIDLFRRYSEVQEFDYTVYLNGTQRCDSAFEDFVSEFCTESKRVIVEESDYSNADPLNQAEVDDFVDRAVPWLRLGYRAAQRRYKGIAPHHLGETFLRCEEKIDAFLQHTEYKGLVVRVTVQPQFERVCIDELWDEP